MMKQAAVGREGQEGNGWRVGRWVGRGRIAESSKEEENKARRRRFFLGGEKTTRVGRGRVAGGL